jgi:hypothetical protein
MLTSAVTCACLASPPAGEALKANITTLGPLVLPFSEQLLFAANMVARRLLGRKRVKPYVPDFTTAFDHICIHTGGRGVIDEIEKHLRLNNKIIEPSRAALFRCVPVCNRVVTKPIANYWSQLPKVAVASFKCYVCQQRYH